MRPNYLSKIDDYQIDLICNKFNHQLSKKDYYHHVKQELNHIRKKYKATNAFWYIIDKDFITIKKSKSILNFALAFYNLYKNSIHAKKKLIFDQNNKINNPFLQQYRSLYVIPYEYQNKVIGFIGIINPKVLFHQDEEEDFSYFEKLAQLYTFNELELPSTSNGKAQIINSKSITFLWADEGFTYIYDHYLEAIEEIYIKILTIFNESSNSHFIHQYINQSNDIKYLYINVKKSSQESTLIDVNILDITKIKDKLISLFNFKNQFITLGESDVITIITLNQNYQITQANNTFYNTINYKENDFNLRFNHYFFSIVSEKDFINVDETIKKAINNHILCYLEVTLHDYNQNPVDTILLVNPLNANNISIAIIFVQKALNMDLWRYNLIPGCIGKFLVGERIKLIYGNDKFFSFFGFNLEKCNNYFFPPVYHEDVRYANMQIEKMRSKVPVNFEIRVKKGNGTYCWVRIEGNCIGIEEDKPVYLLLFVDITQQRLLEFNLQSNQAKLKMITTDENYNLFEYDIINDIYNGKTYFNNKPNCAIKNVTINDYLVNFQENRTDFNYFQRWRDFLLAINNDPFDFCILEAQSEKERWIRVSGTVIYDGKKPVKVIGKFTDYNQIKEKEKQHNDKSQYDVITGLYNKEHGESLVRKYLEISDIDSFLLVIDLDDFRNINHHFGYMFGNVVLSDFGNLISNQIGKDDIAYRLMSDEFVIYLHKKDIQYASSLCNRICNMIKNLYLGETEEVKLSCSIGVARLNNKYQLEDAINKALKVVNCSKNYGVSTFHFLDELDLDFDNLDLNINEEEEIILPKEENIILFAIDILEKSLNIYAAINILLSQIGKQFNLESITIIDINTADLKSNVRHWWIKDNHMLSFPQELHFHKEFVDNFINAYSYNGMLDISPTMYSEFFKAHNLQYSPKLKTIYSCANYEMNKFIGAIFFEPLDANELISQDNKYILFELSKIIFMHMQKTKVDNLNKEQTFLLSKVSHDIRTPLNSIILMTKTAMNYSPNSTCFSNYLDKVDVSANYLLSLVNNILDFTRIESGKMNLCLDKVDLTMMLDNIHELMKVQADQKHIDFSVIRHFNHRCVQSDIVRLNQVLFNLIGNAIKFTPDGGSVIVVVEETYEDNNFVTMKFSVKDNGIGITKENIERIFLPFEQESPETTKKYGGTGLGLTISYSLVKLMGGLLEVESEVGKGSEFYFSLPFLKMNENEKENESINLDYTKFHDKRILLVEDNELNADITRTILENMGFIVDVAYDGTSAIKKYHDSETPYYNAILMDIRMPDMDGFKATMNIRKLGKPDSTSIPIIAMTANAFDEDAKQAIKFGMNNYLTKPIDLVNLYRVLNKYV